MYKTNSQIIREQVTHNVGRSFSHKIYDQFTMPWHYHAEYELIVITAGGGKRFVGDHIDDFTPGELVLLGSGLPHYHMCYGLINNNPDAISSCEVVQFTDDIFPANMSKVEEYIQIADLLKRSRRGLKFTSPPPILEICQMMRRIDSCTGIRSVEALLDILDLLSKTSEYKLLASEQYSPSTTIGADRNDTVNRVIRYLNENFMNEVSLNQIASHLGYNTTSLCRLYKSRAQKSIFETLQEIRVSFACRLLAYSTLSISQIAFECGYKNLSNFNRYFRLITGVTPSVYKSSYKSGL